MELVVIVVILALIQYMVFSFMVGGARGKYGISAPAISGNPVFERYYRVQMNTLEQLAVFLPSIFLYGSYGNPTIAAGLGLVYLIGRVIYFRAYIKDPKKRGLGFMLTFVPSAFMLLAALITIVIAMF